MRIVATMLALPIYMATNASAAPVGSEFQVNSYTTSTQSRPALSHDAVGDIVVVWQSILQDGDALFGVFGQRYASSGIPSGTEFQINTHTVQSQFSPSVSKDPDGDFVVVWTSNLQDGDSSGVFGQRYESSGAPAGSEFQVNTHTASFQSGPSLSTDAVGNFVVTWASNAQDGSGLGIFGQRYDSSGAPAGTEFQVNSYTTYSQSVPSVSKHSNGAFVVVWRSYQDGYGLGIFGQRYDSSGAPAGTEFQVNTYTTFYQSNPSVSTDAAGNFVVVWESLYGQDGYNSGIFGQRYDSNGTPTGTEFQVNTSTAYSETYPSVSTDGSGNIAVVWHSSGEDGSGNGIFGQLYDSGGAANGTEFQVNTYTTFSQSYPSVSTDPGGNFAVVWESSGQDGSASGIFGQRFGTLATATPTSTSTEMPASTPTLTPTPTTAPVAGCPATADVGCMTGFEKGFLLVRDEGGKEKVIAKWIRGPALAQTDMGNPLAGGTGTVFSLCVYDNSSDLVGELTVDRAGDTCDGKPCWKSIGKEPPDPAGKGYKYKDNLLASDGVQKIIYKGGDAGKSKAIVKGKGANVPPGIPALLQSSTQATIQLKASDGTCLSATLSDVNKNAPDFYKIK